MRLGPVLATCALVAVLGTGCGSDDEPEPVTAAELPDNLCAAVPANVVERWGLAEDDHATEAADDRSEATCSMSGTAADAPVDLQITLSSYGGSDAEAVRAMVADEVAVRCDELKQEGEGKFDGADSRCSVETGDAVTEISTAIPAHGVVIVTMSHDGQMSQLLPAEVVGLSGVVANSEPDELS